MRAFAGRAARPLWGGRRFASALPSEADVVVVGGGAVGTSTFYHLAKSGVNVVLVEKDDLTAGTTWHSAGLCWRLRPNDVDIQLLDYTRSLVMTDGPLHQQTEIDSWTANGGLFIANNQERLDEYKRLQTIGKNFGIESHVLKPHECTDVYPLINTEDIVGALHSPGDGLIDPSAVTMAYAKAGKMHGGQVFTKTSVTDVKVENGKVVGIDTNKGLIKTKNVVNAAGAWAGKLGAMAGVKVPLTAMRHAYVVTEPIEGLGFVPNIRDHDLSVYMKWQGECLAIGGYEPNPILWDPEDDFSFGLFDLDWDVFMYNLEGHMKRVPCLENAGIAHTVCGPESFTPDHKALVGPSLEVEGFWFNCGFNSAGIMLSGGMGQQCAEWMVNGYTSLDLFGYDVNRFHHSMTNNRKWCDDRSIEAYAKNYAIVFPHDMPLAGRNMRHTPFHDKLIADGCVHTEVLGWERPNYFMGPGGESTTPKEFDYYGAYEHTPEHESHRYFDLLKHEYSFSWPETLQHIKPQHMATREAVACFDMSAFGKIALSGPDAQKAIEWLCTARMDRGPGRVVYTQMLNEAAGTESDLTVTCCGENDFYLVTAGATWQRDWNRIERICGKEGFDVKMEDITHDIGVLSIQGPKSRELLQQLTDADLSHKAFPFSTSQEVTFAGKLIRMNRLTFVGELGWELHIPTEHCEELYDKIHEVGKPLGLVNAGYGAIESLSLEKGYKHWHQDARIDNNPLEAGLAFACKLKSDIDFLGRTALENAKKEGLRKRLVFVYPEGKDSAIHGLETIYRNGSPCGFLRRGGWSFSLDCPLGVAYVENPDGGKVNVPWIREGSYQIDIMGKMIDCKVDIKTPFDPKNERIKGNYDNL